MIQDIGQHSYSNAYTPHTPDREDLLFVFREGKILCRTTASGQTQFPRAANAEQEMQYLFRIDGISFYLGQEAVEGYEFAPIRSMRHCEPS